MVFQLFHRRTFRCQRSLHFHLEFFQIIWSSRHVPSLKGEKNEFFVMVPCCTWLLPVESSVATRMPEESQDLKMVNVMGWFKVFGSKLLKIQWLESWDHVTSTSCRHGSWPGGTYELRSIHIAGWSTHSSLKTWGKMQLITTPHVSLTKHVQRLKCGKNPQTIIGKT